jgi:hypothetical protein
MYARRQERALATILLLDNHLAVLDIAYNLTVVIHEMYENGINPDFLHIGQNKEITNG